MGRGLDLGCHVERAGALEGHRARVVARPLQRAGDRPVARRPLEAQEPDGIRLRRPLGSRCRPRRGSCSPTRAVCRRRPRFSACPVCPCGTIPSVRSRSRRGRTSSSAGAAADHRDSAACPR
jgi:hypothetical protein